MGRSVERVYEGLDADQRQVVAADGPVCAVAGAGSGKTRVLTRRVARRALDGSGPPEHSLILTFTRKAAEELRGRLAGLGVEGDVTTGTFHATALSQLRQFHLDNGRAVPTLTNQPIHLLEATLEKMKLARSVSAKAVAAEISWAKGQLAAPESYCEVLQRSSHRAPIAPPQLQRIYAAYESHKRKKRVLDLDDLLVQLVEALRNDAAFAAAQRWRFRHLYVDEFQDVNLAQFELLKAWLGERDDIFLVGDSNQAIYGWNGADASYIRRVERHFSGIRIMRLNANYRSCESVLAAAQAVLPQADDRVAGDRQTSETLPRAVGFDDDSEEVNGIARLVRDGRAKGWRWSDIAVLVRTNAQRGPIEQAMANAGVPVRSVGGSAWLHQAETKDVVGFLRTVAELPLARVIPDVEELADPLVPEKPSGFQELIAAARRAVTEDASVSAGEFLTRFELDSRYEAPGGARDAVVVTTFHRAKGLEWPVVVVAGVEEGLVPFGKSASLLEEEQRLFYVVITRARSELLFTWSKIRNGISRQPSRWLTSISRASAEVSARSTPTPAIARAIIEETREEMAFEPLVDDGVRRAVERWRHARATLVGVEERLILSDAEVASLVEVRPTNAEELMRIEGFGPIRARALGPELLQVVAGRKTCV